MSSTTFLHKPQTVSIHELNDNSISIRIKSDSSEVAVYLDDIDQLVKLTKALKSGKYNQAHWLK